MTSHLIDTYEDESFVAVAKFISQLLDEGQGRTALADTAGSEFYKQCEETFSESRFDVLLDTFISKFDVLYAKASDADLEAALSVAVHLLKSLPENKVPEYAEKFAEAVAAQEDDKAEARLSVLTDIFNAVTAPRVQYKVLLRAIQFAQRTQKGSILAPALRMNAMAQGMMNGEHRMKQQVVLSKSYLDAWMKDWNLSASEQQKVLLTVASLFRANAKRKVWIKEAYKLTIRALTLCQDLSSSELGEVKQTAANAVSEFIVNPDLFQFDLLESPAVTQLKDDPKYAALYQLLQLILKGDVQGVDRLLSSNATVLESLRTSAADLRSKTQLLAVLDLAAQNSQIPYRTIQERLGLSEASEVEDWLVAAMGKRLIQGQMDQVRQAVTISKAAHAAFTPHDWRRLQQQVHAWKVNVGNARDLVQSGEAAGSLKSLGGQSWRGSAPAQEPGKPVANGVHRSPAPRTVQA